MNSIRFLGQKNNIHFFKHVAIKQKTHSVHTGSPTTCKTAVNNIYEIKKEVEKYSYKNLSATYTFRNIKKFDGIYDLFEYKYLKIAKIQLNCLKLFLMLRNSIEFS